MEKDVDPQRKWSVVCEFSNNPLPHPDVSSGLMASSPLSRCRQLTQTIGVLLCVFYLGGCGGDGSGSSPPGVEPGPPIFNRAPVARAGADQSVLTNAVVTLDGSNSSDPNSDALTYVWALTTKPAGSTAALTDSSSAKPTFTADSAGAYVATLVVNDGKIDSPPDSVSVTVSVDNAAPVANAGLAQNVATGALVTLDGSASSDANRDALTYLWTLSTKPAGSHATLSSPSSVKPTFIADLAGAYHASLVVNDGKLNSSNAAGISITAAPANVAPVANAGAAQNVVVGAVVTLDASKSSDANGDPLTYAWTLTGRPAGSAAALSSSTSVTPGFTADVAGTYVATLIVSDGKLNSSSVTVSVSAAQANAAPVANAGVVQEVAVNALVTLDGSASSDANGDALAYAWTLTARPAGSAASLSSPTSRNPTFSADVAGTYVATLSVNDGQINSSPATVSITARLVNRVGLGEFRQAVLLKTISSTEISAAIDLAGVLALPATPRYGVQAYRLTYVTQDGQAQPILASALVTLPQKPLGSLSPLLSYQHATIKRDAEAPSNLVDTAGPEVILASLGYIVLSADYVGYGASKGAPHPYLLSGPSAAAVIDLLTAAKYWRQTEQLLDNRQLFLAGYSEGGYVTMATHRALQAGTSTHRRDIVSVVPGAGPYNVGLTLDEALKVVAQAYPLLGPLLQPGFLKYLSLANRIKVRDLLLQQLMGADADVGFMPNFIDNYMADDRAAIQALSDVYDWRPEAPVNLFHGRDDRTVSYLNATSTLQAMQTRGAGNLVSLTDCPAQPAGHLECLPSYWQFLLETLTRLAKDL